MNTDTPETNACYARAGMMLAAQVDELDATCRKLERERDEWKAKYIQQNKDLGCEMMDPNGTIWDHAQTLQRERDALKALLTKEQGAVTISRNGYVQQLERERDEARDAFAGKSPNASVEARQ